MNVLIGKRMVGEDQPALIIAEAGVNHNGSIALAKQLIDAAALAGADVVKFQSFKAEEEVLASMQTAGYQRCQAEESYLEMIRKLELSESDHCGLMGYCREKGIMFMSTPSEGTSAEMLNRLGVEAFKIGSNDIVTLPMLEQVARYHKPMIISRGMATREEITQAISTIRLAGNNDIVLLHCTSSYPSKLSQLNLGAIEILKQEFGLPVGYSDHSEGLEAPVAARLLGAVVIEKHFTLDRKLPGPDQRFSLEPEQLKLMVQQIRHAEKLPAEEQARLKSQIDPTLIGTRDIFPTDAEIQMRAYTRKSIVARKEILKGQQLTVENITFKRPGTGLLANQYREILGRIALRDISPDEFITLEITK